MRFAVTDHISQTAKPISRFGIDAHRLRVMMVLPSLAKNCSSSMSHFSSVMPPESEDLHPVERGFLMT